MEEEFEIKGAHDEAVEHVASRHIGLGQEIAIFSAILATLGAVVSFLGGHTQNDALYYKNEAVLMKARASDSWAYYQAEDLKRHMAEQLAETTPALAAKSRADAERYAQQARSLRIQAENYDRQSVQADVESRHALRPHIKLAIAMTAIQIAIALASITALTRKGWLMVAAGIFAAVGFILSLLAWL
jgi:hypothetical protein